MRYTVSTIRSAGLEARWSRTRSGAPIIAARKPGGTWFVVACDMWDAMKSEGIKPAFERFTLLGDIFSVPA